MKKNVVIALIIMTVLIQAEARQDKLVGRVGEVKRDGQIIVTGSSVGKKITIGTILYVKVNGEKVKIRADYPMMSLVKCSLPGKYKERRVDITKGMKVYIYNKKKRKKKTFKTYYFYRTDIKIKMNIVKEIINDEAELNKDQFCKDVLSKEFGKVKKYLSKNGFRYSFRTYMRKYKAKNKKLKRKQAVGKIRQFFKHQSHFCKARYIGVKSRRKIVCFYSNLFHKDGGEMITAFYMKKIKQRWKIYKMFTYGFIGT